MHRILLFLVLTFALPSMALARTTDEAAIRHMLAAQVTEWNKGNLPGYMKGYWEVALDVLVAILN